MNNMPVSKILNDKVMSARGGIIHPRITINGVTSKAICIDDPTATPIARSILSFIATVTAVKCYCSVILVEKRGTSAALPTMGRRIKPTKASEMLLPATKPSILETKNSAQMATRTVATRSLIVSVFRRGGRDNPKAPRGGMVACSSSASSARTSSYKYE